MRMILTLSVSGTYKHTLDSLIAADFLTIYGKEFGISDSNLHGNNKYSFSEYSLRRKLANEAIRTLVLEHLVDVSQESNGFHYSLSTKGVTFATSLDSDYANEYRKFSALAHRYMDIKNEQELLHLISNNAVAKLKEV